MASMYILKNSLTTSLIANVEKQVELGENMLQQHRKDGKDW